MRTVSSASSSRAAWKRASPARSPATSSYARASPSSWTRRTTEPIGSRSRTEVFLGRLHPVGESGTHAPHDHCLVHAFDHVGALRGFAWRKDSAQLRLVRGDHGPGGSNPVRARSSH